MEDLHDGEHGFKLPWDGRDDLIMSNAEYWREIRRLCPPTPAELDEKPLDEMTEEELNEARERFSSRLNSPMADEIFSRRWLGCKKAMYEWEQGGRKGERPEDISMLMAMP